MMYLDRYRQVSELKSEMQYAQGALRICFYNNWLNIVSRRESFFYKFVDFIRTVMAHPFKHSP